VPDFNDFQQVISQKNGSLVVSALHKNTLTTKLHVVFCWNMWMGNYNKN